MRVAAVATLLLASLFSTSAAAADAIEMKAVTRVSAGHGDPSVTFTSTVLGRIDVSLACAGRRYALSESIEPGGAYTLAMPGLGAGTHACSGTVNLQTRDGGTGQMPLKFQVAILTPPKLSVAEADLDLDARTLVLQADRPLDDVKIEVFGVGGASIGGSQQPGQGLSRLMLSWTSEGEIVRIDVTARDVDGATSVLTLLPWSYQIPHEDVIFASNQAVIPETQVPKLETAWGHVEETVGKYGSVVDIELFVAGYTDTVGPADHNQALSEQRARAIALWFRNRGFPGPIHYQGFGESVLAVVTPDSTDEAANRRALYVLAARAPARSTDLPRSDWTRLR